MTQRDYRAELEAIASSPAFVHDAGMLVSGWGRAETGLECVEPVLRFMETRPDIDYGAPGPLTHLVERFWRKGYEELLMESLRRKPTCPTVLMLNRIINGVSGEERTRYVDELRRLRLHPAADDDTRGEIEEFLERIEELG